MTHICSFERCSYGTNDPQRIQYTNPLKFRKNFKP